MSMSMSMSMNMTLSMNVYIFRVFPWGHFSLNMRLAYRVLTSIWIRVLVLAIDLALPSAASSDCYFAYFVHGAFVTLV